MLNGSQTLSHIIPQILVFAFMMYQMRVNKGPYLSTFSNAAQVRVASKKTLTNRITVIHTDVRKDKSLKMAHLNVDQILRSCKS